MLNCTSFLDVLARLTPEAPAVIEPGTGRELGYAALLDQVMRVAGGLGQAGIGKGSHVCLYLNNSIEYLTAYLAVWRLGAVVIPANIVLREEELAHLTSDAEADAIITDATGAPTAQSVRSTLSGPRLIITTGGDVPDAVTWSSLLDAPPCLRPVPCRFDDMCHIQYTSGTTGRPKGAMLTHGNWMAAMEAESGVLGLSPDDVYLNLYPMAHVGISWGISALRAGACMVLMDRFEFDLYLDLAERYRCTILASMPPVIHRLVHAPEGTEDRLSGVREMISGGGPLHPEIWKAFHERYRIPVVNAYGLSETVVVGTGTATRPGDHYTGDDLFYSVGKPVGYSEVKIVDEHDPTRELGPMETGEIALRGPGVAAGYWRKPEDTAASFLPDGWFLTGDIGHLDGDGTLYITDRKKDMIVMSGWKIYPTEVEEVLIRHPAIRDAAVFGVPHPRRGEIPVAAVVPADCEVPDAGEVIAYAREHLAPYKVPRDMIVVESLPRVHGWKLLRRRLREMYPGGRDFTNTTDIQSS
ncbi:MAG: class I adenylate-forming enzyme family protein [Methanoculleaceae archaeon]